MSFDINNITNEHLIIVVVGYLIVFTSLFLLWLVFYNLPSLLSINPARLFKRDPKKDVKTTNTEVIAAKSGTITGEETAAISVAIFLYVGGLHDEEHTVLTIQKISRRYSPWSSKIYNVINGLNKRF
jgi:glutaconyl-CoA/methylmalonyl-CoA decarboxylase subunit delta